MALSDSSDTAKGEVDRAVEHFEKNRYRFEIIARNLVDCFTNDPTLARWIHFIKYRIKDPQSLANKLSRKARLDLSTLVNDRSVFESVSDLAGVRIIHLHNDQIVDLHPRILDILDENQYRVVGEPIAYCWDDEYEDLYRRAGLRTEREESMYTTVHYDVQARQTPPITCELQVRSLADEVWGEVSHRVNYPAESPSEACRDQLKVLARLTSGCGRLVDSIFKTHGEAVAEGP